MSFALFRLGFASYSSTIIPTQCIVTMPLNQLLISPDSKAFTHWLDALATCSIKLGRFG